MTNQDRAASEAELLQAALAASTASDSATAIGLFKQVARLNGPQAANACFLLAAEFAQLGMVNEALAAYDQTLKLQPGLATARFQMGLLLLTQARPGEAASIWRGLDELGEDDPLVQFKTGLQLMAEDQFPAAEQHLLRGIALNTVNATLNQDMYRVIDEIRRVQAAAAPIAAAEEGAASADFVVPLAYRQHLHG